MKKKKTILIFDTVCMPVEFLELRFKGQNCIVISRFHAGSVVPDDVTLPPDSTTAPIISYNQNLLKKRLGFNLAYEKVYMTYLRHFLFKFLN